MCGIDESEGAVTRCEDGEPETGDELWNLERNRMKLYNRQHYPEKEGTKTDWKKKKEKMPHKIWVRKSVLITCKYGVKGGEKFDLFNKEETVPNLTW